MFGNNEKLYRVLDENKKYRKPTKEECLVAVNEWMQKTSNTEYIWCIYQITIRVGKIVANKPAKYRPTFGDKVLNDCLYALDSVLSAQQFYVKNGLSDEDFKKRRAYLDEAAGYLRRLSTDMYLFLELHRDTDGMKYDDLLTEMGEIALISNSAIGFLRKIKDSDTKMQKAAKEKEAAEEAKEEAAAPKRKKKTI